MTADPFDCTGLVAEVQRLRGPILHDLGRREQEARDQAMAAEIEWHARNPFPVVVVWKPYTEQLEVRAGTTGRVLLAAMTAEAARRMDRRLVAPTLGNLARKSWRRKGWPEPPPNVILGEG